jgi:hypothetical protein
MGKWWTMEIPCPHCALKQRIVVSKTLDVHGKPQRMTCWSGETQQGCMQKFDVTISAHVETQKVKYEGTLEGLKQKMEVRGKEDESAETGA